MDLGDQFHPQLFDTSEMGPAKLTESWDASKIASRPSRTPLGKQGASFAAHTVEKQLPMLMSTREITKEYAPAEGDRLYRNTNIYVHGAVGPTFNRLHERQYGVPATRETNPEIMERKSEEANMDPLDYHEVKKSLYLDNFIATKEQIDTHLKAPTHTTSMVEHLRANKGDTGIIPLGFQRSPYNSDVDERRQLAGAHHRVAAMSEIDPDKLLPVEHYYNVADAKRMPKPPLRNKAGKIVRRFPGETVPRPGYH